MQAKDPQNQTPFIDADEWRDEPVRHRYVHGGFEGTDLLFSYDFQRRGATGEPHGRILNLARVRVVVE